MVLEQDVSHPADSLPLLDHNNVCLVDDLLAGLRSFIILSGAVWKASAFEKVLQDIGVDAPLVQAFKGENRKELHSIDTQAIVDKKFDEQLDDYADWLNTLDEKAQARVLATGGLVRTFSAMDVNSVLNEDLPMSKQPWQENADKLPESERRQEYTKQIHAMFRSQARKISGLSDDQLAGQEVPMNLDLNVVERFGVYKLEKNKKGKYEANPISPRVYVKNKGYVKFMAWFNDKGKLWVGKYIEDGWQFDRISDYLTDYNKERAGRDLGDIPYGIAWEFFLSFLNVNVEVGVDFGKHLDLPEKLGRGQSCIKTMADGYHRHGVEQAIDALKKSAGKKTSDEIVIWNYPKPNKIVHNK